MDYSVISGTRIKYQEEVLQCDIRYQTKVSGRVYYSVISGTRIKYQEEVL